MTKQTTYVLVAEDDVFLADIMEKSLRKHGIMVTVAHDGIQAVEIMDTSPPCLLLLDLLMPRMDGFAVLRHMRERKYAFPVVVLSNLSDPTHREECTKLGVAGYFVKSDMDDDALWSIVEKYLQNA